MLWSLLVAIAFAASPSAEPQFDILGYSPELNAIMAESYRVPDDGKCVSYILDLDQKVKYALPPLTGVAGALIAAGEDQEAASCQLREFEAPLEIKLKTSKTYTAEEKKLIDSVLDENWQKSLKGFKDGFAPSLGGFLRTHRPKWHPDMPAKLYELGTTEAEDKDWVDGFSALLIAADWKPGFANKAGRERARQTTVVAESLSKAKDPKSAGQAILAWEMILRLDPKNVKALLTLATVDAGGYDRGAKLVGRALSIDPVLTTRTFRENAAFENLRCHPKAEAARKRLPTELVKDLNCGP